MALDRPSIGGVTPPPDLPEDPFGDGDPTDDSDGTPDPFAAMPLFGDITRLLSQQLSGGGGGADLARQLAVSVATQGKAEPNVDPATRMRIEELARVAELHVAAITGLPVPSVGTSAVEAVTRTRWVERTLADHRALFDTLGQALNAEPTEPDEPGPPDPADPLAMLAPLMKMMGPMMVSMSTGSMVGHLAQRCFGQYDLPIPRPAGHPVALVATNIDTFAQDWSLPIDDARLWVCVSELTHHAVLDLPHVRARLDELLAAYAGGFEPQASPLMEQFEQLDPSRLGDPDAMGDLLGNPEALLGALRSPRQEALLPELEALVAVVVGYVDHVVDTVGSALLTDYRQLTEALRRRRVEASGADRFVERLLGLELGQAQYDRGRRFTDGVVERAGADALGRLWEAPKNLPTPAEVDAPGLWLARIDLPDA